MSIKRYNTDRLAVLVECPQNGAVVRTQDHLKEVERLQKIIDEQSVEIRCLKRLKPDKGHLYLIQWRYGGPQNAWHREVKSYDGMIKFLDDLVQDSSIVDITVSALHPVKVTRKQVLTVEL